MEKNTVLEKLKNFERDTKWIIKNYDELKMEYPDEWIASFGQRILDHSKGLDELMDRLREKYPENWKDIAIKFVSPQEVEMIL